MVINYALNDPIYKGALAGFLSGWTSHSPQPVPYSIMSGEGTGKVPKRFKTVVKGDIYSSERGKAARHFLEESEALANWANKNLGANDQGAETIEVV